MAFWRWWLCPWLLALVLGVPLISAPCAGPGRAERTAGAWRGPAAKVREGAVPQLVSPGPLVHSTSFQCSSILGEPLSPQPNLCRGSLAFSLLHWVKGRVEKDTSIVGTSRPSCSMNLSLGLLSHLALFMRLSAYLSLSWCLWSPPRIPGPETQEREPDCLVPGCQGGVSVSHPLSCPGSWCGLPFITLCCAQAFYPGLMAHVAGGSARGLTPPPPQQPSSLVAPGVG